MARVAVALAAFSCLATPLSAQGFGQFVPRPDLGATELEELLDVVTTRLQADAEYVYGEPPTNVMGAPTLPDDVQGVRQLHRSDGFGGYSVLQVGFREYASQPVHLWLYGHLAIPEQPLEPNADVDLLEQYVDDAVRTLEDLRASRNVRDLAVKRVDLSYIEPERCLQLLDSQGFYTLPDGGQPDPTQLPVIVAMPGAPQDVRELVNFGTEDYPIDRMPETTADPAMQVMVFYDPARPEQLAQVVERIRTEIDTPARQIVIEAMVLEISETGLRQLGVDWELQSPIGDVTGLNVGRLPDFQGDEGSTFSLTAGIGRFQFRLQTMIRNGQAEVLSRPSVLTLNNRTAYINVIEKIPVASSNVVQGVGTSVTFDERPAGITLYVRPRINANGSEVSMQIHAKVSARVPNADVTIRDLDTQEVVASAPTISEREVRTYTRILNNTPFIIGGLISREDTSGTDKVPILGDIPFLKWAFRRDRVERERREVIILVTPRVLPERRVIGPALPEDKSAFDSVGNALFRPAHRIQAADVFDLDFLRSSPEIRRLQKFADEVATRDTSLAEQAPISEFINGRMPGEEILVYRQIYELIRRLELWDEVSLDRLVFFRPDTSQQSGFIPSFLWQHAAQQVGISRNVKQKKRGRQMRRALGGNALALSYRVEEDPSLDDVLTEQVASFDVVPCPDYTETLWRLNQPEPDGTERYTILLRDEADLQRLNAALVLQRIVILNAPQRTLRLENFHIGTMIMTPSLRADDTYLIDANTAKYFFYIHQYYPAFEAKLRRESDALRQWASEHRVALPERR